MRPRGSPTVEITSLAVAGRRAFPSSLPGRRAELRASGVSLSAAVPSAMISIGPRSSCRATTLEAGFGLLNSIILRSSPTQRSDRTAADRVAGLECYRHATPERRLGCVAYKRYHALRRHRTVFSPRLTIDWPQNNQPATKRNLKRAQAAKLRARSQRVRGGLPVPRRTGWRA